MATKKPNDISTPSADVLRMREDWGLVEALLEGTVFMRKLGETHLPMWPKEDAEAYAARRKTELSLMARGIFGMAAEESAAKSALPERRG